MQGESSFSELPLDREPADRDIVETETRSLRVLCDGFGFSIPARLASRLDAWESALRKPLFWYSSECLHAANSRNAECERCGFQNRTPPIAKRRVRHGEFPMRHLTEPTADPGTQAWLDQA